jgi:hypothetical protein
MQPDVVPPPLPAPRRGRLLLTLLATFLAGGLIAGGGAYWWFKRHLDARALEPVRLAVVEERLLETKLQTLAVAGEVGGVVNALSGSAPADERTLQISGREINAFLAQRGLGENIRVELARDLLHVAMIVPIPADSGLPLLAGANLRLHFSLDVACDPLAGPHFAIRDVQLGGVPLPDAWLGGIKGLNLVDQNLRQDPAVQRFLSGIQDLEVRPDGIRLRLRE